MVVLHKKLKIGMINDKASANISIEKIYWQFFWKWIMFWGILKQLLTFAAFGCSNSTQLKKVHDREYISFYWLPADEKHQLKRVVTATYQKKSILEYLYSRYLYYRFVLKEIWMYGILWVYTLFVVTCFGVEGRNFKFTKRLLNDTITSCPYSSCPYARFVFSIKTSYKVYLKTNSEIWYRLCKFDPAETKSRIFISQKTSWQLKVSTQFIKHFFFKLYVNMKVKKPKSVPNSILIHFEKTA